MAANVPSIMAALSTRLATITGLRVFGYPPDSVPVPAGIVAFPDSITYDDTMARGADRVVVPVHVMVGKVSDRASAPALGAYLSGTGSKSVKAAIEADVSLGGTAQTVRVTSATVSVVTVATVDLLSATFLVEVVA